PRGGVVPDRAIPDPWGPDTVVPSPHVPGQAPGTKPADPDDDEDGDAAARPDPLASPHASSGRSRALRLNPQGAMIASMFVHVCRKLAACGLNDPRVTDQCAWMGRGLSSAPPRCPAAARCLQHIDEMSCGTQPDTLAQVAQLLTKFSDCADAISC